MASVSQARPSKTEDALKPNGVRVFVVKRLYSWLPDPDGYFVFPCDGDGNLLPHAKPEIASVQARNFSSCVTGRYCGHLVVEIYPSAIHPYHV